MAERTEPDGASRGDAAAPEGRPAPGGPRESLPERRPAGRPVSSADLERVIRRASNLQFRAGSFEGEAALEEGEVVRIGEEVGLDPRYVRQALAEVRADSLVPELPTESRLPARLWGPGLVRAGRVVPGDPAEVEARLEAHLRDRELLKRVRQRPGRSLWEAAGGLLSTMKRAMDVGGHGYELAKARSVEMAIEGLEPGWSLVTLTADLRNERSRTAAGFHAAAAGVAAPVAVFLIATGGPELPLLLVSGLAGGAGLGLASWATAAHYRRRRERAALVLQGLLDRLEQGEPLAAPVSRSWRERLLEEPLARRPGAPHR